MRTNFISLIIILFIPFLWKGQEIVAQNVAITDDDTYTANPSAMLDVKSINKGVLLPRLTTVQRNLVSNPATGLLVFDTDENTYYFYNGTAWVNVSSGAQIWNKTGTDVHLADSTNNVGVGTSNPQNKLSVKGNVSSGINEAIFSVVSPQGDTLFAVYPNGTRIYVSDDPAKATGSKGGFAVGGFSPAKAGFTNEYLRVTPDSIRMYIEEGNALKATGSKGGFAVGGFSPAKTGFTNEYLRVTDDSVRVYIEENNPAKATGSKGGFAVGGFSPAKSATINDYLSVNSDSINVSKSLYIPRYTTTERDALGFVPSEALIIFNTTDKCMQIYENSVWSNIWCFNCAPAFIIQPVAQTICSETNANFFVSLTGTNLVYQWQQSTDGGTTWSDISNGGASPAYSGVTSYSLSLANVPVSFNGYKYRCNVSAACPPGVTSSAVVLNVKSTPPAIASQPTDQPVSDSYTASFSISSLGYGVTYQWQQSPDGTIWSDISDGGASPVLVGATEDTLFLSNVPLSYNNEQLRCIASNSCGTSATSDAATLTISLPTLTTTAASNILSTQATGGGNISSNGGAAVTRGVCWSTSANPTIADNFTSDGTGTGAFTSSVTGLSPNTLYYLRAYATNGIGTAYGNEINFITLQNCGTVTDFDGNIYNTVTIDSQCWMQENLKTTRYADGTPLIDGTSAGNISGDYTTKYYFWYNNDSATYSNTYGALYTYAAVMNSAVSSNGVPSNVQGVCPTGWHLPSDAEWNIMEKYLDSTVDTTAVGWVGTDIGGKLKETGTTHWNSPNNGATNSSGFTALPGGTRSNDGTFYNVGYGGYWWSATQFDASDVRIRYMASSFAIVSHNYYNKAYGFSVRCVKD